MQISLSAINSFGTFAASNKDTNVKSKNKIHTGIIATTAIGVATLAAYYLISKKYKPNVFISIPTENKQTQKITNNIIQQESFSKKCMGSDFITILTRRKEADEIFCFKNQSNTFAKVNLHENSMFKQFEIVPVLTDTEAEIRFAAFKQNFQETAQKHFTKIGRGDIPTKTNDIHGLVYDFIRCANYKQNETINSQNIANLPSAYKNIVRAENNNLIKVIEYDSWIWHIPKNYQSAKCKYRMTLNAKIDKDFIKNLDNFIKDNNLQAKYKMPICLDSACKRTDTYNIYFKEEPTQKIKDEICKLAKNHIRANEGIGTKLASGVFGQQEPSGDDVRDFIKICCAINPYLYKNISLKTSDMKYFAETASAGQIEACKIILEKILQK